MKEAGRVPHSCVGHHISSIKTHELSQSYDRAWLRKNQIAIRELKATLVC